MKRFALLLLLATGCTAHLSARVALLEKDVAELKDRVPSGQFSERLGGPEASDAVASVGTWVPAQAARLSAFGARNSGGTMSLAAGNPVTTGTTISTSWANNTLSDIAAELTDSLSRSGKGGMTAGLKLFAGTSSLPGLYFGTDTSVGWFQQAAGTWEFATTGAIPVMDLNTTATFYRGATLTNSSANGRGVTATGTGSGDGVLGTGGTSTGVGVRGTGGTTSGAGGTFTGGATNGNGTVTQGTGTGAGMVAAGGATGKGIIAAGGATSDAAIQVQAANAVNAPFRFDVAAAPSGPNVVGDMYMAAGGVLKVCTVAGTPGTFVSVGSQ